MPILGNRSTFSLQDITILNPLSVNFYLSHGVIEPPHLLVAEGKIKPCSMIDLGISVTIKL